MRVSRHRMTGPYYFSPCRLIALTRQIEARVIHLKQAGHIEPSRLAESPEERSTQPKRYDLALASLRLTRRQIVSSDMNVACRCRSVYNHFRRRLIACSGS